MGYLLCVGDTGFDEPCSTSGLQLSPRAPSESILTLTFKCHCKQCSNLNTSHSSDSHTYLIVAAIRKLIQGRCRQATEPDCCPGAHTRTQKTAIQDPPYGAATYSMTLSLGFFSSGRCCFVARRSHDLLGLPTQPDLRPSSPRAGAFVEKFSDHDASENCSR